MADNSKSVNIPPKEEKKEGLKPKKARKPPTWAEITEFVYTQIGWYATRFIIFSTVGVVVGFIALVYMFLTMYIYANPLQDLSVFLGAFIGVGAIATSLILLALGAFWRRKVENQSIF